MIIIENEKDQRIYDWLLEEVGEQAIQVACSQLAGNRKTYISNIVKILKITIPKKVIATPKTKALQNIAQIKKNLDKKIKH